MRRMNREELLKLQSLSIEMANYFVEFCQKNGLTCYLCGGGCIGAVRHKGMIPWDDDLDFFMPREDYEKAIELWGKYENKERYVLEISDKKHVDGNLFFTIRDKETTFIKPYQKNMDITHGIVLDVLPLDGYPSSKLKRKWQCICALFYSLFCAQIVPEKHGIVIKVVCKLLLSMVPNINVRYIIWSFAKRQMTKYRIEDCDAITELCSGPNYMRNRYPKEIFQEELFVEFDNYKMPIPVGYDKYLKIAFGDYMILPPEKDRVAAHEFIFMDLDNSYENYKGVYYLK